MNNELNVEKQIIHLLLKNKGAVTILAEAGVRSAQFDEQHRLLVDAVFDADSRNTELTRLSLQAFLDKWLVSKKEKIACMSLYATCFASVVGVKLDDLHALVSKKKQDYTGAMALKYLQEFQLKPTSDAVFNVKDLAEKLSSLTDDSEQRANVTFNDISGKEFWNQWESEFQHKLTADLSITDCGIPELDNVMGIGFDPETLTVICADTGGFKSTMMLNIALNIWKRHNKDVLFVGLEMPRNRLMDKILSREAKIPFNYFQRPKSVWTEKEQVKLNQVKTEFMGGEDGTKGRFVLLEFGERTSVSQIRRQIEKHLSHFKPCVVVIDYIANLEPDAGHKRKDRNDLEIGDMLKALMKMGKPGSVSKEGFGIVTGAQLNRDALKRMKTYRGDATKFMFSSEDIQGSHQYAADATSIFCLYPDPMNKNRLFVFPVKNRYGQKVYQDGSNKAALDVDPQINNISSPTMVTWKSTADDDILVKGVTPPKAMDDPWADDGDSATQTIEDISADDAIASGAGNSDSIDSIL